MAKLTEKEMEQILQNEIPLESLEIDSESGSFMKKMIWVLVWVMNILDLVHIALDIFLISLLKGEYINISGMYVSIFDAVKILTEEWNKWQ